MTSKRYDEEFRRSTNVRKQLAEYLGCDPALSTTTEILERVLHQLQDQEEQIAVLQAENDGLMQNKPFMVLPKRRKQ